ncbi:hypothetical protein P167DRAFT_340629 [Morchella conica CCBAS932]|uniref:Protein kinase domain-containing protein n=1 Tax=Morchella conica CCBAS932 TaxID=1392247 RepID=A0A3N4KD84_9PEZI|nr:hypothetical protein P167DRAFT_340629 [Morchella conica CCBAS932]
MTREHYQALKLDGQIRGDYVFHEGVGYGGFSIVHRCTQMTTGRIYAVKVLWTKQYTNPRDAVSYPSIFPFYRNSSSPSMVWWANSYTCSRMMSRTKWRSSRGCATPAAHSLTLSTTSRRGITVCTTLSTLSSIIFISWSVLIYDNLGYIVTRFADKGDLDRSLVRHFEEYDVADIMLDVFTGLNTLHNVLGIAHRGKFSLCFGFHTLPLIILCYVSYFFNETFLYLISSLACDCG